MPLGPRRRLGVAVTVAAIALGLGMPAHSVGFGANFTYTNGSAEVEDTDDVFPDVDIDSDEFEVGFSFDTSLARDRLLNYRLNANFASIEQDIDVLSTGFHIKGYGVALNQVFGFGVYRSPHSRVFLGPAIHLGYGYFDDGDQGIDFEAHLATAAIGPEVGINIHAGDNLTVSVSGFYRFGVVAQFFEEPFDSFGSDGILVGEQHRVGVTTTIFFRLGSDQFAPPVSQ